MLKVRGGHRFEGYGNVRIATNHGTRSGWQLTCCECKKLSDTIHRTGSSFPPKVLVQMFSEKGWKVGNTSEADVCPACLQKRRERAREERKQYAKGNVDRLLDMIRQVDLMLASNMTIDYGPYQPQIAAQLKSLFETAYLCNMLPSDLVRDVGVLPAPAPEPTPAPEPAPEPEPSDEALMLAAGEMSPSKTRAPEQPSPESPPPEPLPPPPERIAPRTAAFLAEIRKQIFQGTIGRSE